MYMNNLTDALVQVQCSKPQLRRAFVETPTFLYCKNINVFNKNEFFCGIMTKQS